jgi:predicted DNA-binding protein YlxM (UPF0122 family)
MINRDEITLIELIRLLDKTRFGMKMQQAMSDIYLEGLTVTEAARHIKVSRQAVHRAMYRLEGVAMREL